MIDYPFVAIAYIILIISLGIRLIGQISIVRTAGAHSQQKQNASRAHALLRNGQRLSPDNKKTQSMSKQVKFRKIPLKLLIETLIHIHDSGADYIDIIGVQDDVQDVVTIAVEEEYLRDDTTEKPDNIDLINDKLSDEDINDLLT